MKLEQIIFLQKCHFLMFFRRLSGTPRTAKLEEISNRGLLLCKDKTPNYYVRKGELRTSNGLAVVKL